MSPTVSGVEWLHPVLDQSRKLIGRGSSAKRWTKSAKGHTELVTEIDLAVERLLIEAILERVPTAAILSEETHPDPGALSHDTCFVIDPIDGTNELAAGRPGFAISIALFKDGQPVAALLDLPAHDQRFEYSPRQGTNLNGKAVHLPPITDLSEAKIAVSATQRQMEQLQSFWQSMKVAELIPTPAFTPKFAAVLAGQCHAALYLPVNPHRTAIWDYAAAALLLMEAGGWWGSTDGSDLLRRRPFEYAGGWIASPTTLRDELLALARRIPKQSGVDNIHPAQSKGTARDHQR